MKKLMILMVAVVLSIGMAFAEDCGAPFFNTLRFCEELEKDGIVIESMIILNADCTWEWQFDGISAGGGTWHRQDPNKLNWIVFNVEDPNGIDEPAEALERLYYSVDNATRDIKFKGISFLSYEHEMNMTLCGEE